MSATTTRCTRCSVPLSPDPTAGRFCTNCGAPRADRTSPPPPPPVHSAPAPPRFPMFADEAPAAPAQPVELAPTPPQPGARHRRRVWLPWLLVAAAATLLVVVGVSVVAGGEEQPAPEASTGPAGSAAPDGAPDGAPTFAGDPGSLVDLADADAPSQDVDSVDITTGEPTTYTASNLLDGDVSTGWRVDGDASGTVLTFTFDDPVTLTSIGLVNGYAKSSLDAAGREFDLYAGSRRVLEVDWVIDGGDPLPQRLRDDTRSVQLLDVGALSASTVALRIVSVSGPGEGPAARDKTAISEVALTGYPG